MRAKQNRMLSLEKGADLRLGFENEAPEITQSLSATSMARRRRSVYFSDQAATLWTCFTAPLECEWSPLTPCTNTRGKQAYQSGLLEQDKH